VEDAGVTLMCAHNQLFPPAIAEARRVLATGELGQVYEVRTSDAFQSSMTADSAGWRANSATNGGGELIDTGYHPSYLLVHLTGGSQVGVMAMTANHRVSFLDAEDSAQVLVRFDNGVIGSIASLAYRPPRESERFSVLGEKGSMRGAANGSPSRRLTAGREPCDSRKWTRSPRRSPTSPGACEPVSGRSTRKSRARSCST
jgi:predicted dehydrogenase